MIIGILSDSHGDAEMVRSAVAILRRHGAERLFHCGDVCGTDVLDELLEIPTLFVWGNMDRPDGAMYTYCEAVGLTWPQSPLVVELAGKRIGVYHGHEHYAPKLLAQNDLDYVLFGHSHEREDRRCGRTRFINPGALHRAPIKSVATLDLTSDALTFYEVPTGRRL